MEIKLTKQAELDLVAFDIKTKQWVKENIEKLPVGEIRKLADFSTAYRLRIADYCVVFEERPNRKAVRQAAAMNREQLLAQNAIVFVIMKIIPRPITWMEEIESVRVGRDEARKGDIKNIEEIDWS